jgi:alkanesulfonate monooxygenase SsuD/methylene tetrahydromethanopterin reductase-like flavin-dependent oxidoreductase (luciferase family)
MGASSEGAIRRAARLGDTLTQSAHFSIDELEGHKGFYLDELAKLGKPVPAERPITRVLYLAEDRDQAIEEATPALANWYRRRGEWGWFLTKDKKFEDEVFASGRWIIGNPEDCVNQILNLQSRLGINHTIFNLSPGLGATQEQRLRTIRLLGDEVIPGLRAAGAMT